MPPISSNSWSRKEEDNTWFRKKEDTKSRSKISRRPNTTPPSTTTTRGNPLPQFPHTTPPSPMPTRGSPFSIYSSTTPSSSSTVRGLPPPKLGSSGNYVLPEGKAGYPGLWGGAGIAILASLTLLTMLATAGLAVMFHKRAKRYKSALIEFALKLADLQMINGPEENDAIHDASFGNVSNQWSDEAMMEEIFDTITQTSESSVILPGPKYATWGAFGGYDQRHRNKAFLVSDGIEDFEWSEPSPRGSITDMFCPRGYSGKYWT